MTSVGCRSGVHWMRVPTAPSTLCAIARASTVFAVPGDVLEEHVATRRERGEHEPDLLALPVDDRLHVREQACGDVDGAFEPDADRLLVDPWRGHSRHPRARTSAPDLS